MNMKRIKLIVIILVALLTGASLTALAMPYFASDEHAGHAHASHDAAPAAAGEGESYYTCPMHPSVISDTPGACPVCHMDLIKKSRASEGMSPQELAKIGRVAMNPTQRVLANVQTTRVEAVGAPTSETGDAKAKAAEASEIRAVGIVTYNENGLASVPSWLDGRIEALLVKETGARLKRGQSVVRIYSPELLTAQQEFLIALENADVNDALVAPTRQRLLLLGMSEGQVAAVEKSRKAQPTITMSAPNAGTITDIMVRQGQYVEKGTPLFEVADLSTVWVDAEVYARDLPALSPGMDARITSEALPGESMRGKVTFIQPTVASDTRTVKVRVELDNRDGKLKPGMYMSVFFSAPEKTDAPAPEVAAGEDAAPVALRVPRSAVLRGGKTNSVYVEIIKNVFERRNVTIGRSTDRYLIVTDGLKPGDKIAYQGVFLLDSEVELNSFGHAETKSEDAEDDAHEGHAGHQGHAGHEDEDHAEHKSEEASKESK